MEFSNFNGLDYLLMAVETKTKIELCETCKFLPQFCVCDKNAPVFIGYCPQCQLEINTGSVHEHLNFMVYCKECRRTKTATLFTSSHKNSGLCQKCFSCRLEHRARCKKWYDSKK